LRVRRAGIAIPKNYSLELWLYSKPWSLPANQSYPISYWIDRNAAKAKTDTLGKLIAKRQEAEVK
jgi:hypothetical protein